jgi:Cys-rich four helix bundle protein (predicted Tat secretion target)
MATEQQSPRITLNRREVLIGMGAAAVGMSAVANASEGGDHSQHADHKKHDHSKHSPQQPTVLDAVNGCLDKGQRCITHCLAAFQEGDLALADCAAKVHEMQAICAAFSYLLAANSGHIEAAAALCDAVCEECADECRKHDHHVECRECAEACETTIAEVRQVFG